MRRVDLGHAARWEYVRVIYERYGKAAGKAKGMMLDAPVAHQRYATFAFLCRISHRYYGMTFAWRQARGCGSGGSRTRPMEKTLGVHGVHYRPRSRVRKTPSPKEGPRRKPKGGYLYPLRS